MQNTDLIWTTQGGLATQTPDVHDMTQSLPLDNLLDVRSAALQCGVNAWRGAGLRVAVVHSTQQAQLAREELTALGLSDPEGDQGVIVLSPDVLADWAVSPADVAQDDLVLQVLPPAPDLEQAARDWLQDHALSCSQDLAQLVAEP
jgi:hypothetical protein